MPFFLMAMAAATIPTAKPVNIGSWFTADDYPAEAAINGVEGSVTFDISVDEHGAPTACRIAVSSGSTVLDQATCDIVMKRSHFKPAMRRGRAVAGHYSNQSVWRLEGQSPIGWTAASLDFSKDPAHPICSVDGIGGPPGPSCDQIIKRLGSQGPRNGVTKLTAMISFTMGSTQPFTGKPEWGKRVSFVAFEIFPPKNGAKAACVKVSQEGASLDGDPCADYADAQSLSNADKQNPNKAHIEQSVFELAQPRAGVSGKCKSSGSEAEARGCV